MSRRRTHRSDINQRTIVKVLRQLGCWVECIGRPFDLLVGRKMVSGEPKLFLIEVKNPDEPSAKLTKAQKEWVEKHGLEFVHIIETAEEAIKLVTESYKS